MTRQKQMTAYGLLATKAPCQRKYASSFSRAPTLGIPHPLFPSPILQSGTLAQWPIVQNQLYAFLFDIHSSTRREQQKAHWVCQCNEGGLQHAQAHNCTGAQCARALKLPGCPSEGCYYCGSCFLPQNLTPRPHSRWLLGVEDLAQRAGACLGTSLQSRKKTTCPAWPGRTFIHLIKEKNT